MTTLLPGLAIPDEIQSLIATLREAESRLVEITGGQIDAITDAEGRTFLLRRAQEDVRRGDASTRAAILNSLPASVVLLDASGVILSVNESWRRFGIANGLKGHSAEVGSNYLRVCREAHGEHSEGATWVADGLTSVLDGTAKAFGAEYPCHSPSRQRWFQMAAIPLTQEHLAGVVVMHSDITDRKLYELALEIREAEQRESARLLTVERSRLVEAQRVAKIGSWETDLATSVVVWSEETHRIFETDPAGAPPAHDAFLQMIHPQDRARLDRNFLDSLERREAQEFEYRLLFAGNRVKYVESRWQVMFDAQGVAERVVGTNQDISERKLADFRIQRLNRGYRVLSQINALIIRVNTREELFQESCRIAVETGRFPLAWIGVVDAAEQRVVPVASTGADSEFLAQLGTRLSFAEDAPLGHGPTAVAVREKRVVVVNDVATDPVIRHAQVRFDPSIRSLVSLPLIVAGEVVAVLGLHTADINYFDEEELDLVHELANDISFAIDHIGKAERLNYVAFFDPLTGLANRSLFLERVAQCLPSAACHSAVMVLVDLERFKSINDSLGVHAGDDLLKQVATWLSQHLADPTLLARVGSDLFVFMLTESDRPGDAARNLERLIKEFHDQTFLLDGSAYRLAAKFGVATFPDDANNAHGLFQKTESALKSAKAGGHRHLFYTQEMTDSIARKMGLENQLRHALDNHEFVLHYQPKIDLRSDKVVGAEALIRWYDPRTQTLTPPVQFIPILEETGLIIEVGRWAIGRAIEHFTRRLRDGLPAVRIAVNVSAVQLRDPNFVEDVRQLLSVDELAHAGLEIEITESMIMTDIEQSIVTLGALREMGVRIAIDDFGTGFSSLGYLAKLPVDSLKIDRSFVTDMTRSPEGLSLVSTIITLAHSLHLKVVAEGVETEEERGLLKLLRCDEMQGYLFSKPVPLEEFEARFLRSE